MSRFILSHKMMSMCLMDANFYESTPSFKEIKNVAMREYEIRKASLTAGAKKGCSSCGKKKAARVRVELEKRHGALFSQHVSVLMKREGANFSRLRQYVRDHYGRLTGKQNDKPTFELVTMYVPIKNNQTGFVEAAEVEL